MARKQFAYYLQNLGHDILAGIVVFLVALPLCLGIALASGAPLLSGVIAGLVGGLIVAWASGSQLSVSGPAAGLTVIVLQAIESLGSFPAFLTALVIAGAIQLSLGFLKAGVIGAYIPSAVIKGMLCAIGLILIMKQLPHAVGYEPGLVGEETYIPQTPQDTLSEFFLALNAIAPGAAIVSSAAILIMLLWESRCLKKIPGVTMIPGPLVAVLWGVLFNVFTQDTRFAIPGELLVSLPDIQGFSDFMGHLILPDFSSLATPSVYSIAVTLAIIASLETLLSLEAADKLDPMKRVAPTNRELKAQGIGNLVSGFLGGLPITAVIVRTSANINAGGRTKMSCFIHGFLLLLSVTFVARYLNAIPLAALAAILLLTGYKLAKPGLMLDMYRKGVNQFTPFLITVIAILLTDLLKGIGIGIACGLFYVVKANFHAAISLTSNGNHYLLRLRKDVSFLNKALLRELLARVEPEGDLIIDGSQADFIDQDILETIHDFLQAAPDNEIAVQVRNMDGFKPEPEAIEIPARQAGLMTAFPGRPNVTGNFPDLRAARTGS